MWKVFTYGNYLVIVAGNRVLWLVSEAEEEATDVSDPLMNRCVQLFYTRLHSDNYL